MQPAAQDKIMQWGCLALLIVPFGAAVFAVLRQWEFAASWVAMVGIWIAISRQLKERDDARVQDLLQRAFASHRCPPPALIRESYYGYPAFVLVFDSPVHQAEADRAGAIIAFKEIIQQRYAHLGGRTNPFNAELAVSVTQRSTS